MPADTVSFHDSRAVARARKRMLPPEAERILRPLGTALCDPVRLKICMALSGASLSVKDLALVIGRSQSTTSQHLRILRDIGAVRAERDGRRVTYSITPDGIGPQLSGVVDALDAVAV